MSKVQGCTKLGENTDANQLGWYDLGFPHLVGDGWLFWRVGWLGF